MRTFNVLNRSGSIGSLSRKEFLAEAKAISDRRNGIDPDASDMSEEIGAMIAYTGPVEEDEIDQDDDEGTELVANSEAVKAMLWHQLKPTDDGKATR